jgi:hypothetical protein
MKILKLIFTNVLVIIGLLLAINILLITFWEVRLAIFKLQKPNEEKDDPRVALPNYQSAHWAKAYFRDFNKLKDNNYFSYVGWRKVPYQSTYINIDSQGFRYTPQHPLVKNSAKKIIFLGGSTMWGTGAPDSASIPAFFAQLTDGKYFIINFGESGYRALQSFNLLFMQMSNGLSPQYVISYDGVNEAVGLLTHNHTFSQYPEMEIRAKLKEEKQFSRLVTDLTFKHYFIDPILSSVARLKTPKDVSPQMQIDTSEHRIKDVASSLLNTWLLMHDLCKRNNSIFIPVLQPNSAVGNPKTDYLTLPYYEKLLNSSYKKLYAKIIHLIDTDKKYAELKSNFLDLSQVLDKDEPIYIDWCHLSPNGNIMVAKAIYQHFEQLNIK